MSRLEGKIALVTAAGQGIGRAIAVALAKEGAQVLATDINDETLATLGAEVPALTTRHLDVRDADAIKAVAADFGSANVLVNCAGFVHDGTILDCDEETWAFSFDLNVTSAYRMIRAYLPRMLERGGGSIVNIASVASSIKGVPNRSVYSATKAAVIGLTKSVAADFVDRGIRCNAICPGTIDTPSLDERIRASGDYEAATKAFLARQPMARMGTPGEVAALALYLASDEAAFTTGQTHIIDGGWVL